MEIEIRGGVPAEIRADEDGTIRVSGHAAVFNQDADIGGMFIERIEPGAFLDAIGRDDVVFLIEHQGLPLARTSSGTLQLSEDEIGLRMETILDHTDPDVARILPKMRRGDLSKMSFAFLAELQEWDDSDDIPRRTIKKAWLRDVSVVTYPAYDGTDIGLRMLEQHRKVAKKQNYSAAARRVRMKAHLALRGREVGRSAATDSLERSEEIKP